MHTEHQPAAERSFSLFQFFLGDNGFELVTVTADDFGVRIALLEIVNGERSGALLGFLWRHCPECGWDVSLDVCWMGLIYGQQ